MNTSLPNHLIQIPPPKEDGSECPRYHKEPKEVESSVSPTLAIAPYRRPSLPSLYLAASAMDGPPGLTYENRRRFTLTHELYSRSISLWDDLERRIECSGRTLDEWIEAAHQLGGFRGLAHAAHLQSIKDHLYHIKKLRKLEQPRQVFFNKISPSRLVTKV
ncbi:MAG: hypothetical protein A3F67_00655 [Verrucomicrobia bacterium RIFCSPHIGHO2_12_FULL_41_10]|nr:MAG: hypothetical protein A3F67_00655 [Verrucomicrobia bacterium RIFCSPHIGHO2_12_FULL_41_10]HLB34170.1 hypothetical protein [Chthoniobacterales bacterium]